mmetsp:Transcript_8006/g.22006  ORF Transcript_8006/g.22006 Transcript_8006/m.22006 type:complete len:204 (-) Transcript_8006:147-758(-)
MNSSSKCTSRSWRSESSPRDGRLGGGIGAPEAVGAGCALAWAPGESRLLTAPAFAAVNWGRLWGGSPSWSEEVVPRLCDEALRCFLPPEREGEDSSPVSSTSLLGGLRTLRPLASELGSCAAVGRAAPEAAVAASPGRAAALRASVTTAVAAACLGCLGASAERALGSGADADAADAAATRFTLACGRTLFASSCGEPVKSPP